MKGQISFRRSLITNIAIAMIIVFVCAATFSTEIQNFVAGALNAPVFKGNLNGRHVALAISVCDTNNIDEALKTLNESGVEASIFLCPNIYKTKMDLVNTIKAMGIHTGIYMCEEHANQDVEIDGGEYILCSPFFKKDNIKDSSKVVFLSGTIDANKIYSSKKELILNENMIIVYNIDDSSYKLKTLLNEIAADGYTIVNVLSILNG